MKRGLGVIAGNLVKSRPFHRYQANHLTDRSNLAPSRQCSSAGRSLWPGSSLGRVVIGVLRRKVAVKLSAVASAFTAHFWRIE
jgi:hypothetical protein